MSDDEQHSINNPTAIVPYYDKVHPRSICLHAHKMIKGSRLFDFDPLSRETRRPATHKTLLVTKKLFKGAIGNRSWAILRSHLNFHSDHDRDKVTAILCDMYKNLLN